MNEGIPSWLPPLILFENHKGWKTYIDAVYKVFYYDFVQSRPFFAKLPIYVRQHPSYDNKGATFWHLISEGTEESERTPDLRRCERISWPKAIIENLNENEVKIWETTRTWKGQQQRRINFSNENFSYLVVIASKPKGFDLVTAYGIESTHRREKLKKEFDLFSSQKKEGSAV